AKLPGCCHRQFGTIFHRLVRGSLLRSNRQLHVAERVAHRNNVSLFTPRQRHHLATTRTRYRLLSVDAVTAVVAHELRTPLGAIALNASTAISKLRSNPPDLEEMDDILGDIEAESYRAGAIISSMRELTKKTTDRRALAHVEDVVRVVLRLLQYDL